MNREVPVDVSPVDSQPKFSWTTKHSRDKIKNAKRKELGLDRTPIEQIHLFPAELWLDIFSRLDYVTLNSSIPYVCRDFYSLLSRRSAVSAAPIDVALFRDFPADKISVNEKYTLHRMLARLLPAYSTSVDFVFSVASASNGKIVLNAKTRKGAINLPNKMFAVEKIFLLFLSSAGRCKSVWKENATSPAVRSLSLKPERYPTYRPQKDITLTSTDKGITVFDVMIASLVSLYHDNEMQAMPLWRRAEKPLESRDVRSAVRWVLSRHMHQMNKRKSLSEPWDYVHKWLDETGFMGKMQR